MTKEVLQERTKRFAIQIVKLYDLMPKSLPNRIFFGQLIRSGSSVGANYRAACRAKSSADFINKLKIVEEESDESIYFLELLMTLNEPIFHPQIKMLIKEGEELLAIFVSSIKTSKQNLKSQILSCLT
jgi:four helix bundle protein